MADDETPSTLVCVRVRDLARPTVPSDQAVCRDCLEPVWKSRSGWWWTGPILCVECCLTRDDNDVEGVAAPWVRDDLATVGRLHRIAHRLDRRLD
jgi:hypothetical protein